jgi:predicted metal-dependent HD superfamily phosphohydrolase
VDIVLAGLEIQRFVEDVKKEKIAKGELYWELRIGINTGDVIAGVIGTKRFAYDIWGDTVNVASSMEQQGKPGKVNISEKTYKHIRDFFDCTPRGKISAKNKGEINMYFVDRIKPHLSVDEEGIVPNELFYEKLSDSIFYINNYLKAEQYILKKLESELPKDLYYHAFQHTLDVRDAAEKIAKAEGVEGEELMMLKTAAIFHDAGFIHEYFKNESIGAQMAKDILPKFGYSDAQINEIEKMILATAIPQNPRTLPEMILCDADLDYLGRKDFYSIGESLKKEFLSRGIIKDNKSWDELQISFLTTHRYFTDYSKKLRDPQKQLRIAEIKKRLESDVYNVNVLP